MRHKIVFLALSLVLTLASSIHRAEAACVEESIRKVATGSCCSGTSIRQWETYVCQDGVWVPTGQFSCSLSCLV